MKNKDLCMGKYTNFTGEFYILRGKIFTPSQISVLINSSFLLFLTHGHTRTHTQNLGVSAMTFIKEKSDFLSPASLLYRL